MTKTSDAEVKIFTSQTEMSRSNNNFRILSSHFQHIRYFSAFIFKSKIFGGSDFLSEFNVFNYSIIIQLFFPI